MHEPLLQRIDQLERSVRRWRLVCFALAIIVVSLLAIGGTFGTLMMLELPARRDGGAAGGGPGASAQAQAERAQAEAAHRQAEGGTARNGPPGKSYRSGKTVNDRQNPS